MTEKLAIIMFTTRTCRVSYAISFVSTTTCILVGFLARILVRCVQICKPMELRENGGKVYTEVKYARVKEVNL